MTIDSILTNSYQTTTLSDVQSAMQTQSATSTDTGIEQAGSSTDKAQFSKHGELMSKLASLQSSDPAKFKEAAQKIADSLSEQAESSTDDAKSKFLSELSDKFASAAKSGNMSSLQPPQPGQGKFKLSGAANASASQFKPDMSDMKATFESVDSAISDALSGASSTSA